MLTATKTLQSTQQSERDSRRKLLGERVWNVHVKLVLEEITNFLEIVQWCELSIAQFAKVRCDQRDQACLCCSFRHRINLASTFLHSNEFVLH